jgi:hypothetical protein
MKWIQGPEMVMKGASREQLKHYGRVELLLRVDQGILVLHMEVVDARRALLSVSAITDRGWNVRFEDGKSFIQMRECLLELKRRGCLYVLEGRVQDARQAPEVLVMPVED